MKMIAFKLQEALHYRLHCSRHDIKVVSTSIFSLSYQAKLSIITTDESIRQMSLQFY